MKSYISLFDNVCVYDGEKHIDAVINDIKSDCYKQQISVYREILRTGMKKQADGLKKNLPGFTPSGTFTNGRKADLITSYSGFLVLDLDKLSPDDLLKAKETVKEISFTYAAFVSPSANGLKIIVPVDSSLELHRTAMSQVVSYYENALQLTVDPSGKDVSRLCFVSHDPDCFHNPNAETFKVNIQLERIEAPVPAASLPQKEESSRINNAATTPFEHYDAFRSCVLFTEKKATFVEGYRNNFIHQLACNCNRRGIPLEIAETFILQNYQMEESEASKTIKSAYANNLQDFAKDAKFANSAKSAVLQNKENSEDTSEDYLKTTPTIPIAAINLMPKLFKEGASAFESDARKRDVFITSALCIISGCLPDVYGVYHQERVSPHLFSFIIAPAASGKGVLKNAKRLGDKVHERLVETSKRAKDLFDIEMVDYKHTMTKRKNGEPAPEKPIEPAFKMLFIPADCSQAMMMQVLQDNEGKGIICETEADAMSGANKQDWGNYSHIMRAAFHHEKISAARKTNRELLEIKHPQLAVALSGTPSQVPKLIASSEDGLFSRFLFYAFKNEIEWQDPSPKPGGIVYNDHFEELSKHVLNIVDFLSQFPTEVYLTQSQWAKLNLTFIERLKSVVIFTGEDAASVVFRLGLILYRFCMIFSALRKFENGDCAKDVTCIDEDFQTALMLSEVYLQHSLLMFNNLEETKEPARYKMPNNKKRLLEQLPEEFQRKDAIEIGKRLGLSVRSVDDFLNNSVSTLFDKPKTGFYQKVKK
ncbi:MAG: DUF3987 domain-containing protein [Bacteroidales bacterium]